MLCGKLPQVQYIQLIQLIHVLKAVAIVTSEHLNFSTIFVVSLFLIAKAGWHVDWMEVKPTFRDPEKVSSSPQ